MKSKDITYHQEFGLHLGELIKEKRSKPETVAAIGGIEPKAVYRVMNADHSPTLSILKAIADGLGITVSELLDFNYSN